MLTAAGVLEQVIHMLADDDGDILKEAAWSVHLRRIAAAFAQHVHGS